MSRSKSNKYTKPCAIRRRQAETYAQKKFRRIVRERDNYTCQRCGQPGKTVHHIFSFRLCKTLYNDPDNGVTLCDICHDIIEKRKRLLT